MIAWIKKIPHWPLVVGLAFLFLGLAALLWGEPEEVWRKVVYAGISEIGFAFIIAWIVSIFVEQKARQEYTKEIMEREITLSKNIFNYLYSIRLPKSIFNSV